VSGPSSPFETPSARSSAGRRPAPASEISDGLDACYPTHYGTRIVVHTSDRSRIERTRLVAPGDPDDPMSVDDLTAKFVHLAEPLHDDSAASLAGDLIDPDHCGLQSTLATVLLPTSTA
jgi:2-methylcitrate dehydratase PrpD